MRKSPRCGCAEGFQAIQAKADEYDRVKTILNRGKHPTFVGRRLVLISTRNGGCTIFRHAGADIGVSIVNPMKNVLLVLNVIPEHRSHGIGSAILRYVQANFARVLESAVPFFERNGYSRVGAIKRGNSLNTQVMIKSSLIPLAGRLSILYNRNE
jgi:GNAT superfamily N-acetyltransferase